MNQFMRLQRIRLRESCHTDITFVRFLTGMNAKMPFQFECVGRCVCAVRTLEWPFTGVTPKVTLQFAQLHAGIIAFGTFVRFLVCVLVTDVSHHFTGSGEAAFAALAFVRFGSGVSVGVILK